MTHIVLVGVTTVIFGVASLILISKARNRLSEGSIKKYMDNFAICLAFIVIFSVWQTTRSIFGININVEGLSTYPEYIFVVFAYVAFIITSYKILKISEEFGFKDDGRRIENVIKHYQAIKPSSKSKISKPTKKRQSKHTRK